MGGVIPLRREWLLARTSLASVLSIVVLFSPFTAAAEEIQELDATMPEQPASANLIPADSTEKPATELGEGDLSDEELDPEQGMSLMSVGSGGESTIIVGRTSVGAGFKLEPSVVDGSLQYELPLTIPPGRNGVQPDLKLTYNSNRGSENSIISRGWELSIPYIERRNYAGTEQMWSHASFYSTLSGELASTSSSTVFKEKVSEGNYRTYTFSGNTWTVTDRNGLTYKFGHASTSQQYAATSSQNISKWMLDEVRDLNGNYVSYSYAKDSNQIYPTVITYTGNGVTPGIFDIHFATSTRATVASSTALGFEVGTRYQISEIRAEVSDSTVRTYTLGYGTGANGSRPILTSVTETGQDGSTTLALPASAFAYQTHSKQWTQAQGLSLPEPIIHNNDQDYGTRFADVNGDGLADVITRTADGTTNKVYLHNGSGWTYASSWSVPVPIVNTTASQLTGTIIIDVNGDGRTDVIRKTPSTGGIYLNNGSNWASSTGSLPVDIVNSSGADEGVRAADVNGDGLPDLLQSWQSNYNRVFINNGTNWVLDSSWSIPEPFIWTDRTEQGTRIVDVNGDGLADIIKKTTTQNRIYINNGNGWTLSSAWSFPSDYVLSEDRGVRFDDVNGDGLVDFVVKSDKPNTSPIEGTYINNGSTWALDSNWQTPPILIVDFQGDNLGHDTGVRLVDVNGDGLSDFIKRVGGTSTVYYNSGVRADQLAVATSSQGGSATMTYKATPLYQSGGSLQNPYLPLVLDTVSKVTYRDGLSTWDNEYVYEGGLYTASSTRDRKFTGFEKVSETDALGHVTKQYFHQGSTTSSSLGEYDDHLAKIGKLFRKEVTDGSGNLFAANIYKWDRYDRGDGASLVKLVQSLDLTYDGDADHKDKAESYTYNDNAGVPVQKIEWGEVTGSADGTFSDTDSDKFTTAYSYATSTATSTIFSLSQETTTDQAAGKVRETRTYYDTLSLGSLNKANPTKVERWRTGSSYTDTEKTYNSYGLVTQELDPRDKQTTYTYDSQNLYIASTTNPLSQVTGRSYDYSSGKVATTTDANSRVFVSVYDPTDRLKTEKQPDLTTPSTLVTKAAYVYNDSILPRSVEKTAYLNSGTSSVSYLYTDGFGRKVEERTEGELSPDYVVRDFRYDQRGRLSSETLPFFGSGTAFTGLTAPTGASRRIEYTYDPLSRVIEISNVLGDTTNTYDQWTVTTTDPESNTKDFTNDAYARLVSVIEHEGASTFDTTYEYDGNGNLTKLTDDLANIRNFTYDGLNRRLTAQDLHDVADGTFGSWSYGYDDAGNLTSYTDPKSQTVNLTYDNINRVLTEDYTGAAGTEITYGYDSCSEGVGRLCAATTSAAVTTFTYNALGLPASESKAISSQTFMSSYTYDRQGNLTGVTYPDAGAVAYTHNTAGQLEEVSYRPAGGSYTPIITDFDYAPTGKVAAKYFANGVISTYDYDSNELYRLARILTLAPDSGESLMGGGGEGGELSLGIESLPYASFLSVLFSGVEDSRTFLASIEQEAVLDGAHIQTTQVQEELETPVPVEAPTPEPVQENPPIIDIPVEPEPVELPIATSSPVEPVPSHDPVEEMPALKPETTATTTPELPLEPPPEVESLALKASVEDLLGYEELPDGVVRYAYKTNVSVDDMPVSKALTAQMQAKGLEVGPEVIERRTKYARTFTTSETNTYVTEIVAGVPQYYQDDNGNWWLADYATTTKASYDLQTKEPEPGFLEGIGQQIISFVSGLVFGQRVYADTTTFYPDANTVDGTVMYGSNGGWAAVRNASSGGGLDYTSNNLQIQDAYMSEFSATDYRIRRGFITFDTSSIPDTHTVASSSLSLHVNGVTAAGSEKRIYITSSDPAGTTTLGNEDYDQVGSTSFGASDGTYATTTYEVITLNASGISHITQTGVTELGIRTYNDFNNVTPTNSTELSLNIYSSEQAGTASDPKLIVIHSTTPTGPNALRTEGQVNPTGVIDPTPEFSAIYNDPDVGNTAGSYNIQVSTTSDFSSIAWDSGKVALGTALANGERMPDVSYAGSALGLTTYYWRIKFWDDVDLPSPWSTETATFVTDAPDGEIIQDIAFDYDDIGNILTITDHSDTGAGKSLLFGYDDLYRLTSASTTAASSTPFTHTYAYNSLGNLTSMSGAGSYAYAETGYANPHAPTTINGVTLAYDNNGNLTSQGSSTFSWNYRNRLATSTISVATSTYAYDHVDQRVKKVAGGITTLYPNQYYSKASATSTKYIWAGDELLAYVEGSGTATTTHYVHADHLGSTNVVTDTAGQVEDVTDYLPYGSDRISTGNASLARGFIGQFEDANDLSYLNARYYDNGRGQFVSEDPIFLAIGDLEKLSGLSGKNQRYFLSDPQQLNSYSYARNNPMANSDPTGLATLEVGGQYTWSGISGNAGLAIDPYGFGYYVGTGVGMGAGSRVGAQVNTGNLANQYSITVSGYAEGGDGVVGHGSVDMTYYPYSTRSPESSVTAGVSLGGGAAVGQTTTVYVPLYKWGMTNAERKALTRQTAAVPAQIATYRPPTQSTQNTANQSSNGGGLGKVLNQISSILSKIGRLLK